jgi:hypothetical protein
VLVTTVAIATHCLHAKSLHKALSNTQLLDAAKEPLNSPASYLLLTSTIFLKFSISLRIWSSSRSEAAVVSFSAVALYQCTDVISTHLALVLQSPMRGRAATK